MNLIVGLGNPGQNYAATRHNIGKSAVLSLANKLNLDLTTKKNLATNLAQIRQGSVATILAYPTTFMNESGIAGQKLINFYKINPKNLYVIHDDLDLEVGEWKLQFNRGPAGHHGVESIIQHLGTQEFWRYRIGIGKDPIIPVESYVLQPFKAGDLAQINTVLDTILLDLKNRLGL